MLVGYARVSMQEPTLKLQLGALRATGFERLFTDTLSGAKQKRKGPVEVLEFMRKSDHYLIYVYANLSH